MKSDSPVLRALARLYGESRAGRTGAGQRDFLVDFKKLLAAAGCEDGDDRETAIRQLRELNGRLLRLEGPRRDADIIHQVRLPLANEASLFELLGDPSPAECRQRLAQQFAEAVHADVPDRWREPWQRYFSTLQKAAIQGATIAPFSREDLATNSELLTLVPKLLAWHAKGEESLLRFASCVLTSNSKRLGEIAAEDDGGIVCSFITSRQGVAVRPWRKRRSESSGGRSLRQALTSLTASELCGCCLTTSTG